MVSIKISEIGISSIVEINANEMISIKGGFDVAIDKDYFTAVDGLQQLSFLFIIDDDDKKDLLDKRSSLSVRNISQLFALTDVEPI